MTVPRDLRLILSLSLVAAGWCSPILARDSTDQIRQPVTSGFLRDYSQLKKGGKDQAQLVYVDPAVDFKKYNRILFEPVVVYVVPKGDLSKIPPEELQSCINYLYAAVRDVLSYEYDFVDEPGPDVMRLRVAITDIHGANVALNTVSTVMPIGLALSAVKKVATGTASMVSSARVEMEIQDSLSGERLIAAVDARAGKKITGHFDKFDKYAAIHDAYDYWAKKLHKRLQDLRQGAAPTEGTVAP